MERFREVVLPNGGLARITVERQESVYGIGEELFSRMRPMDRYDITIRLVNVEPLLVDRLAEWLRANDGAQAPKPPALPIAAPQLPPAVIEGELLDDE